MKTTVLNRLSLIFVSGEDATSFLQGQLTNDVTLASSKQVQMTAHCSPKGRVLINFMLFKYEDQYCLALPKKLVDYTLKRLQMFVMRSKVKLTCVDARFALMGVIHFEDFTEEQADLILINPKVGLKIIHKDALAQFEDSEKNDHAYVNEWDNLMIDLGYPFILPETQDQFIPQMINLDLLDGINFKKGCYTGQEIVARTQYLGKLKRRMYLLSYPLMDNDSPHPGDSLYTDDMGDQASGMIVNVALDENNLKLNMLAVLQVSSVETQQPIHWKKIDGNLLNFVKSFE